MGNIYYLTFFLLGLLGGFIAAYFFLRNINLTPIKTTDESSEFTEDVISTKDIYEAISKASESSLELRSDLKAIFDSYQNPILQGAHGEDLLKLYFENSGLIENEQFIHNEGLPQGDGRPDFVIKLPGNGAIYVDSKFITNNFVQAHRESDKSVREELFNLNAENIETTARDLARRKYTEYEGYISPNFVFMFLPTDNIYADAVNRRKDILSKCYNGFAAAGNTGTPIILITPSSLGAALKVVSMLWNERNLYEHIADVSQSLNKLHSGLLKLNKNFIDGGNALLKASNKFRLAFKDFIKVTPEVKKIENKINRENIRFIGDEEFMANSRETELSENDINNLNLEENNE